MKFLNWIEERGGPRVVAAMINTESPTVIAWLDGRACPRPALMLQLVKLGQGAFDFEDIIRDTKFQKAKRKKSK